MKIEEVENLLSLACRAESDGGKICFLQVAVSKLLQETGYALSRLEQELTKHREAIPWEAHPGGPVDIPAAKLGPEVLAEWPVPYTDGAAKYKLLATGRVVYVFGKEEGESKRVQWCVDALRARGLLRLPGDPDPVREAARRLEQACFAMNDAAVRAAHLDPELNWFYVSGRQVNALRDALVKEAGDGTD